MRLAVKHAARFISAAIIVAVFLIGLGTVPWLVVAVLWGGLAVSVLPRKESPHA